MVQCRNVTYGAETAAERAVNAVIFSEAGASEGEGTGDPMAKRKLGPTGGRHLEFNRSVRCAQARLGQIRAAVGHAGIT